MFGRIALYRFMLKIQSCFTFLSFLLQITILSYIILHSFYLLKVHGKLFKILLLVLFNVIKFVISNEILI